MNFFLTLMMFAYFERVQMACVIGIIKKHAGPRKIKALQLKCEFHNENIECWISINFM